MKYNMIFIVYVDNTILSSPEKKSIEAETNILGDISDEHRHEFGLRDEEEVGVFLEL